MTGYFETLGMKVGRKIDRGIAGIGKSISAFGRAITRVGDKIQKLFEPEDVPKSWREKAMDAIGEEEDEDMTDDEMRDKYDEENDER